MRNRLPRALRVMATGALIATLAAGCSGASVPGLTAPERNSEFDRAKAALPSDAADGAADPTLAAESATPATDELSSHELSTPEVANAETLPQAGRGVTPPRWLGTLVLPLAADGYGEVRPTPPALRDRRFTLPDRLPPLPGRGFRSRQVTPAPDDVLARSTWRPGCPVPRDQVTWLQVTFVGFDERRHTGELLVNSAVADDVTRVFRDLWRARFPIEEMRISRAEELDAPPTGDGNNTEGLVCRAVTGGSAFSQHAYGTAIDLNPFQNPYQLGDRVLPERASAYLDRDDVRPGMILPDDPVVRAFAAIGWSWGGDWRSLKDYQHFSLNGR